MDTVLYRAVRKALKNMPMDEEERHAFEQWQSGNQPSTDKESNDSENKEPSFVQSLYDIIDGKYDNDRFEVGRLICIAYEEMEKPGCRGCSQWKNVLKQAENRLDALVLLEERADGEALKKKKAAMKKLAAERGKLRGDEPDWLFTMLDILDGKYDEYLNDLDRVFCEINNLVDFYRHEFGKPNYNPLWKDITKGALDYMEELHVELFIARNLGTEKK